MDPTNEFGTLDVSLHYLFGLIKADTKLARINEPPPGKDCNVFARRNGPNVEIVTERPIYPGNDEIYMDYGNVISNVFESRRNGDKKYRFHCLTASKSNYTSLSFTYAVGVGYDRSAYGNVVSGDEFDIRRLREEQKRAAEEENEREMKLQPIRVDADFDEAEASTDTTGLLQRKSSFPQYPKLLP